MSEQTACPHEERMAEIYQTVERLDLYITGGKKPQEGLIIRLDRLEQFTQQLRWILSVIAVSSVGILVIAFASLLGIGSP